jgi:hypothetical protein
MGEMRYTNLQSGNLKERDHLADLDVNERIILELISKKCMWMWTGFIWLRIGTNGRLL